MAFGMLSMPIAAFGGRRTIMNSLNYVARGAGRVAAEFNLHYEGYR
jgi:hypothetical protein